MIHEQIKKLFGTKLKFCQKTGHKYKDLASKIRTVQSKLDWLNEFLKPLRLKAVIVEDGYETVSGVVKGVGTSGFKDGDVLYVSPTEPGGLTNVEPIPGGCPECGERSWERVEGGFMCLDCHHFEERPIPVADVIDTSAARPSCPDCGSDSVSYDAYFQREHCGVCDIFWRV